MDCPHCAVAMRVAAVEGVPVQVCSTCSGVLVAQNRVVPLLTALGKSLVGVIDIETALQPLSAPHVRCACPTCHKPMDVFAYAGTNLVKADRCADCWQVWATADELGLMAALFLRTQQRVDRRQQIFERMAESMASSTRLTLAGNRVADRLASALIVGV